MSSYCTQYPRNYHFRGLQTTARGPALIQRKPALASAVQSQRSKEITNYQLLTNNNIHNKITNQLPTSKQSQTFSGTLFSQALSQDKRPFKGMRPRAIPRNPSILTYLKPVCVSNLSAHALSYLDICIIVYSF